MTAETFSLVAGAVLSLAFAYVPGLEDWYSSQESRAKAAIMAVALLLVAVGSFAMSCTGQYDWFTCDQTGGWQAAEMFLYALAANQGTYQIAVSWRK